MESPKGLKGTIRLYVVIVLTLLLVLAACDLPPIGGFNRIIRLSAADVATLTGSTSTTSDQASIIVGSSDTGETNIAAFRFPNATLPHGATIESASLSLLKSGSEQHHLAVDVAFELSASPADFTSGPSLDQRQATNAVSHVDDTKWRLDGRPYEIGDPTTLGQSLQEVVNLTDWQSGGSLVVLAIGPSNPTGAGVAFSGLPSDVSLKIVYRTSFSFGNTPTPTSTSSATDTATSTSTATVDPTGAGTLITVGEGAVDNWQRSIVRDQANRVWIVAANNDPSYSNSGPAQLRIYKGNKVGIPSSFSELQTKRVLATNNGTIPFMDAALNGNNQIEVAWVDHGASQQPLKFRIFDIQSESWTGAATTLDSTGLSGFGGTAAQGGLSLALDADGYAHIAYAVAGDWTKIDVKHQTSSGWSSAEVPIPVDTSNGGSAYVWHPALALGTDGTLYLAVYDSTNQKILAAQRSSSGTWSSPVVVSSDVLGPQSIDQGPSLLITPAGVPTILYLSSGSYLRVQQLINGSWTNVNLGGDYFTHAPGLGVFADGTLAMAGHDNASPPNAINIIFGTPGNWGTWKQLVAIHADGSEVFRWAGAFSQTDNNVVDLLFFDEDTNDDGTLNDQTLYYIAIKHP